MTPACGLLAEAVTRARQLGPDPPAPLSVCRAAWVVSGS